MNMTLFAEDFTPLGLLVDEHLRPEVEWHEILGLPRMEPRVSDVEATVSLARIPIRLQWFYTPSGRRLVGFIPDSHVPLLFDPALQWRTVRLIHTTRECPRCGLDLWAPADPRFTARVDHDAGLHLATEEP